MRRWHEVTKKRHIYLLVCWQVHDKPTGLGSWRFSLETADGDKRLVFPTLKHAYEHVQRDLSEE